MTGQDAAFDAAQLARMMARCEVIDLAPLLVPNMVKWPTHPDLAIIDDARSHEQDGYFLQTLIIPEHVGCHVDAPSHAHAHLADRTIDRYPADCIIGPAKKVDVSDLDLQPGDLLTLAQYQAAAARDGISLEKGDIALVQFGWDRNLPGGSAGRDRHWWGRNNPGMDVGAADAAREHAHDGAARQGRADLLRLDPQVLWTVPDSGKAGSLLGHVHTPTRRLLRPLPTGMVLSAHSG